MPLPACACDSCIPRHRAMPCNQKPPLCPASPDTTSSLSGSSPELPPPAPYPSGNSEMPDALAKCHRLASAYIYSPDCRDCPLQANHKGGSSQNRSPSVCASEGLVSPAGSLKGSLPGRRVSMIDRKLGGAHIHILPTHICLSITDHEPRQ